MKTHFIIHKGELSFEDNCIEINDKKSKRTKSFTILSSIFPVLYGILIIIKYFKTNDPFDLWPGLILVILGVPGLIIQNKMTFINKINFHEIDMVIIKSNFSNSLIADFKISNGKKRRVILDFADLGRFEKFSLDDFIKNLSDKNIKTEIK
jgi:predicted nucleic acid-binding Zn ribbon protein